MDSVTHGFMDSCIRALGLTRSKWLKDARNSLSCSWLMPLASRVRIWFSISLMVRAMVVRSCSQPTRMCCRAQRGLQGAALAQTNAASAKRGGAHLHGVVGVLVVKDQRRLNQLMVSFQLVDLWFVVDDALLVLAEVRQLVLQRAVHLDGDASNFLHRNSEVNFGRCAATAWRRAPCINRLSVEVQPLNAECLWVV